MEQPHLVGHGVLNGPVSRETAEHYRWGGADGTACDGWHLVKSGELSVIEERMPPGTEEVRHMHLRARQFFHVLAGELTLEVSSEEHWLGVGAGLEIAPGVWHQALNRGVDDARFLVVSQPHSHGDRIVAG